ncbi:hypothetical protein TREMEDRAFT_73324 [Tremella mesenterica DSM 1558]|uniref:uncharacterized protein n=1 Tax=Tremella mesenterica (strain ATCC 24925 / CBS 8224 / DSM 1558 / NBRC 9311 / NRRL Y-6157 / RJB 2259-6 / UBC 559-6) TaxID=578456 RepID=UPI0003F494B0|nr:uncharacterized protein TREMEDRAFT_73324 [Tremella mesenterica DSM 1558]EIW71500.1 hypothetical protein TREMEDRAFT_73324 [Tremella mesenterica DSM 1558]
MAHPMPPTFYPIGGISCSSGGRGIFFDTGLNDAVEVWVDVNLPNRLNLIYALKREGARITTQHYAPSTSLLILAPGSESIFDLYCHSEWLRPRQKLWYERRKQKLGIVEEEWQKKVILMGDWVEKCIEAGRFLGEEDGWGGARVGGPPPHMYPPSTRSMDDEPADPALQPDHPPVGAGDIVTETLKDGPDQVVTHDPHQSPVTEPGNDSVEMSEADELLEILQEAVPPEGGDTVPEQTEVVGQRQKEGGSNQESAQEEENDHELVIVETPQRRSPTSSKPPSTTTGFHLNQKSPPRHEHVVSSPLTSRHDHHTSNPSNPSTITETPITLPSSESEIVEPIEERLSSPRSPVVFIDKAEPPTPGQSVPPTAPLAPVDPSEIFAGCRFRVDLDRPGRKDLINRIKAAGGQIIVDFSDATHVLIHIYTPAKWDHIIRQYVQDGVWFMHCQWALDCLDKGRKIPELNHHVPGGAPILLDPLFDDFTTSRPVRDAMPAMKISQIFLDASRSRNMTLDAMLKDLSRGHGMYDSKIWKQMYMDWAKGIGMFAKLDQSRYGPPADLKPSILARANSKSVLVKDRVLSTAEMDEILRGKRHKLQDALPSDPVWLILSKKYTRYSRREWYQLHGDWVEGTGRFKEIKAGSVKPPSPLLPVKAKIVPSPSPSPAASGSQQSNVGKDIMSTDEMVSLFKQHDDKLQSMNRREVASYLHEQNPAYTPRMWINLHSEYLSREGRFSRVPRERIGGRSKRKRSVFSSPEIVVPPPKKRAFAKPYTEKEERAMAAYIVGRLPEKTPITAKGWEGFKAGSEFPTRSTGGYVEHYRNFQPRINGYAKQIAKDKGVEDQLEASFNSSDNRSTKDEVESSDDDEDTDESSDTSIEAEVIEVNSSSDEAEYVDMTNDSD